jgi:putative RNA 2'-phosphotransferase
MSKHQSKFLSLVLRHQPELIGIVLDDAGWTDVDTLLAKARAKGTSITRDELVEIVKSSDKQRFALSSDGTRIRANQGHSVEVELDLPPTPPPAVLLHGTVDKFLDSIRKTGLVKGSRHHVHLSADLETASKVGARRGKPVLLEIRADADGRPRSRVLSLGERRLARRSRASRVHRVPDGAHGRSPERPRARGEVRHREVDAGRVRAGRVPQREGRTGRDRRRRERGACGHRAPRAGRVAARTVATSEDDHHPRARDHAPGARAAGAGREVTSRASTSPRRRTREVASSVARRRRRSRSRDRAPCIRALLEQRSHYERNRHETVPIYLDLAIWSPRVPFFKTDRGDWIDAPVLASVITCAAPNASALRQQKSGSRPRSSRPRSASAPCWCSRSPHTTGSKHWCSVPGRRRVRQRSGDGRGCVRDPARRRVRQRISGGRLRGARRRTEPRGVRQAVLLSAGASSSWAQQAPRCCAFRARRGTVVGRRWCTWLPRTSTNSNSPAANAPS